MKQLIIIALAAIVLATTATFVSGQTPTPTPDIPITVSRLKVRKLRNFPAEVEIHSSIGTFVGTGTLQWGPLMCTSVAPCLSGTRINTAIVLKNMNGTVDGTSFHAGGQDRDIGYYNEWVVPYQAPWGRPLKNLQTAYLLGSTLALNPTADPTINYVAPVNLVGTMKFEMAPLKRFQSPGPYTEFVSIELDLVQTPPPA